MTFFAFISKGEDGWLWFLGKLVPNLSLVFTMPELRHF